MQEMIEHAIMCIFAGMMMGLLFFKTCVLPSSGNIFEVTNEVPIQFSPE